MRILVATVYRRVVGGVETYLAGVLPALAARGHALALLYQEDGPAGRPAVDAGLPAWRASGGGEGLPVEAARWGPDVVYLQGLRGPPLEAALAERFPTVLYAHNYNGTCVSGAKRFELPVARPCGRRFGPACLLHYLPRRCGGLSPVTMLAQYATQRRRLGLLGRYRAVLVASRHMRDEFGRHGVPEERLGLLPLFPTDGCGDGPPPAPPASGRVLLACRLTRLKGGRVLVEALRRAADRLGRTLTLVAAGDGPERPRLEALAARRGVPAEFAGWVGACERARLMRGADLLAVPSLWPEPFGLVGVEAGGLGLPAVGFASGGVPDWLRPGESGELAPADPPTAAGLADAVCRALADPAHLARLRAGAWRVAGEYTRAAHVARLEAVLAGAARS